MTPERWEKLADLHRRALERPDDERAEFLAQACAGDDELRIEVESLLAQPENSFLEKSALEGLAAGLPRHAETGGETLQRPSMTGRTIAHYQVLERLGAGGMGEVYRARDTKLQRDVALKILPQALAHDADRMARFEREAQVLASLNHPNIAAIHGLEESNGIRALVMELVEGETLGDKIAVVGAALSGRRSPMDSIGVQKSGPREPKGVPYDDALPIVHQIAEALEYAHERGVIHRDLKPANVKITPEGTVKVLDFGLAKVLSPQDSSSALDPASSPSLTAMATQVGMLLGTAAYMSPEQAKGQRVDRRCDIWAFGCVLFEMLSGRKTFEGETISDVLAAVIKGEPDWDALPATTPPSIQRLIRRCLVKDSKQRLRDIGEARIAIDETISGTGIPPVEVHEQDATTSKPRPPLQRFLPWALASLVAGALISGLVVWKFAFRAPEPRPLIRFSISPPENATLLRDAGMSLSPDGRRLAFISSSSPSQPAKVWVRPLGALTAKPLQGTEGARGPFWSPDGNDLGFYAGGELEKVAISGGPPQTLCKGNLGSATWSKGGVIVFASNRRLYRVPATGGTPTLVAAPDRARDEGFYVAPQFLPDGRHFLFLILPAHIGGGKSVAMGSLGSRKVVHLTTTSSNAFYAPPGYLLYMNHTTLMARPFDAAGLKFTGQAVPIAEGVGLSMAGYGHFTVSQTGALAYGTGGSETLSQMVWVNRKGEKLGTVGQPGVYTSPALSPDGTKIAVGVGPHMGGNLWVYDLKRGTASRLTFNPAGDEYPVWSADGSRIFFSSNRQGHRDLYEKPANGLGSTQPVYVSRQQVKSLDDLSRDGRYAIYDMGPFKELRVLPLFGAKKPSTFIQGKSMLKDARISPNGRYVAYMSAETGRREIYVQTFPHHRGKWQISTAGGSEAMWRSDGRELFYLSLGGGMMSVAVNTAAGQFQAGTPKLLFQAHLIPQGILRNTYAVSPDGQRFLLLEPASGGKPSPITVVLNWPALLKKQ